MKVITYSTRSPVWNKPFIFEQWKRVEHPLIPYANGPVYISTLGRVWNENKKRIIIPWNVVNKKINRYDPCIDYRTVKDGIVKYKKAKVCRLVLMLFDPIPNPEEFTVNHMDGNTMNNCIYNLSWSSGKDNIRFAYMNGQMSYHDKDGNKVQKYILPPDKVDQICILLIDGYTINQISSITGAKYKQIHNIATGTAYKDKYDEYNLGSLTGFVNKKHKNLTNEDVYKICEMLYNGIDFDTIAGAVNCSYNTVKGIRYDTSHKGAYQNYINERNGDNMSS